MVIEPSIINLEQKAMIISVIYLNLYKNQYSFLINP